MDEITLSADTPPHHYDRYENITHELHQLREHLHQEYTNEKSPYRELFTHGNSFGIFGNYIICLEQYIDKYGEPDARSYSLPLSQFPEELKNFVKEKTPNTTLSAKFICNEKLPAPKKNKKINASNIENQKIVDQILQLQQLDPTQEGNKKLLISLIKGVIPNAGFIEEVHQVRQENGVYILTFVDSSTPARNAIELHLGSPELLQEVLNEVFLPETLGLDYRQVLGLTGSTEETSASHRKQKSRE